MATPFVPVPFPVPRSGGCRSWSKRTSRRGSHSSGSSGSSPTEGGIPWVRGGGGGAGCSVVPEPAGPSLPQPCTNPGECRRAALDGSSVLEDGNPGDSCMDRPHTPTLLGYEIMEERAKFTVYKILVTGTQGDSWVIFRRYADFSMLNDKLKEVFPRFRLALPPKRWFKDNYDMDFLEERQIGLQTFLQNLIAHKDIINSEAVRHFLCLDEPPGPFDSLEESRAFCETLEETNHRLQGELLGKQREIDRLKLALDEKDTHIGVLEKTVNGLSLCPDSSSSCGLSAVGVNTESAQDGQRDAEASRDRLQDTDVNAEVDAGRRSSGTETDPESSPGERYEIPGLIKSHGAYWSTHPSHHESKEQNERQ